MSKLSDVVPTRFTAEESQALKNRARLSGKTPSEIVRMAVRNLLASSVEVEGLRRTLEL